MSLRKHSMPRTNVGRSPAGLLVRAEAGDDDPQALAALVRHLHATTNGLDAFQADARNSLQSFDGRLSEIEQHLARGQRAGPGPVRNAFRAALDGEACREALAGMARHKSARFTVRQAILSSPPTGVPPPADRRPEIVASVQRALRVRDLLTVTPTSAGSIEFVQETGFSNAAAVVSEGAEKPETSLTFDLVTQAVRTIAHWTQASRQVLDDVSRLGSFLDTRMRYGVQLREDDQLLLGDGTGQNLTGLVVAASAFSAPAGIALDTMADRVGASIAQLRSIEHEPDGVVLNPNDWQKISQEKGGDGHYLIPGGPFSTAAPVLFNKPVALTTAMPEDEFLVGQFTVGAELFEREETVVELSTEDRDNFIKNLVTVRAEERVTLAIYRPEAFVTGDFGNIS